MEFSKFTPIETWHRMRLCNTFYQYSLILLVWVLNLVKWAQWESVFPILMRFLFSLDCGYRMTYAVQCSAPVFPSCWVRSARSLSQPFLQEFVNSWLLAGCSEFPEFFFFFLSFLSFSASWLSFFTTGLFWLLAISSFALYFTSPLCCTTFFSLTATWAGDLFLKFPPSSISQTDDWA